MITARSMRAVSGRHRALTRRPWWQVALSSSRRGRPVSSTAGARLPRTSATVLLAATGAAGVLVGSTLDPSAGSVLMLTSALVPSVVLGGALARARTALERSQHQRHRVAGELAVSDEQLRRLADRLERQTDAAADSAAELERTRRQLRRARVEVATSRAGIAGAREEAARARSAAVQLAAARDEARAAANLAEAEAEAALEAARRAEQALERAGVPDRALPWTAPARVAGQRSFASVDMRVFDAFTEADMADEDAVLDAPARRGRHAATAQLDLGTAAAARTVDLDRDAHTGPMGSDVREVA